MDSYKKVRYSDFIYMMRMRADKNFLSEGVREQVVVKKKPQDGMPQDSISPEVLAIKDKISDVLIPLEIKITKSKDSEKDQSRFLLFCKENLKIYNNIDEYIKDAPSLKTNSDRLDKDIEMMVNQAISHVVTTDFGEAPDVGIVANPKDVVFPDDSVFQGFNDINNINNPIFQQEPAGGMFH